MTGSSNNASVDRRLFIGGSDARIIMSADEAALIRLRREKRGESEPDDLSDNLIVQLGVVERRIRKSYFDRVAEKADEDEEKKKVYDRNRKNFKNAVKRVLDARTVVAVDLSA